MKTKQDALPTTLLSNDACAGLAGNTTTMRPWQRQSGTINSGFTQKLLL